MGLPRAQLKKPLLDQSAVIAEDDDAWTRMGPAACRGRPPEIPQLIGFVVPAEEVSQLANAVTLQPHTDLSRALPGSWCFGPTLQMMFWMAGLDFFIRIVMLTIGFFTADCHDGSMVYSSYVWILVVVFGCCHFTADWICLRYAVIPFIQQVGEWKVMSREWFAPHGSFAVWCVNCLASSAATLSSKATPGLFTGTVLAQHFKGLCREEEQREIWNLTLRQSPMLSWLDGLDFWIVVLSVYVMEFVPLLLTLYTIWPMPGQWQKGGVDMRRPDGARYLQDFELECVEEKGDPFKPPCSPLLDPSTITGKSRPWGTRHFYFSLSRRFVLSAELWGTLGEANGLAVPTAVGLTVARSLAASNLSAIHGLDKSSDTISVEKGITEARKCVQHYVSTGVRMKLRVFFKGFLNSGLQLQTQITFFAMTAFLNPTGANSYQVWLSIFAAFANSAQVAFVLYDHYYFYRIAEHAVSKTREITSSAPTDGRRSGRLSTTQQIDDLMEVARTAKRQHIVVLLLALAFYGNLCWALLKLVMANVCEDHLWNVNLNLMAGCSNLARFHV